MAVGWEQDNQSSELATLLNDSFVFVNITNELMELSLKTEVREVGETF